MRILIHWFLRALAVFIAAYLLRGVHVDSLFVALVVAVVIGFLNTFIRPILVLISLPFEILTLGLFTFVINAFLIILVSNFVEGFRVDSFYWALFFSIVLSIVNGILNFVEPKAEKEERK